MDNIKKDKAVDVKKKGDIVEENSLIEEALLKNIAGGCTTSNGSPNSCSTPGGGDSCFGDCS